MNSKKLQRYYHVCGLNDPHAECLLIIPGLGAGKSMFDMAIPTFDKRFKIIVVSSPGIDKAPRKGAWFVKEMAKTVLEILDAENVTKCHILGHSMGGMIAQSLYHQRPEIVDNLVLVSSTSGGYALQKNVKNLFDGMLDGGTWMEFFKRVKGDYVESIIASFSKKFIQEEREKLNEFSWAYLIKKNGWERSSVFQHLIASSSMCLTPFLKNIKARTLVIHGNEDNVLLCDGGLQLAALIPNARFLKYDACGHFPFVENETVFGTIYKFLVDKEDVGRCIEIDEIRDENADVYISPYPQLISMLKEALNYIISRGKA